MTRTLLGGLLALVAGASLVAGQDQTARSASLAPPTPAERFENAQGFEPFVFADTARQTEWLLNYKRAVTPVDAVMPRLATLTGQWHILVIAESWCNDAVNSIPYLARLAAAHPNIELRLLRKSEAPELLAAHPLEGRSATPVVLIYDERFVERGVWIERPAALKTLIASKEGRVCEDTLKETVKAWRLEDEGRSVLNEVIALIERAAATSAASTTSR